MDHERLISELNATKAALAAAERERETAAKAAARVGVQEHVNNFEALCRQNSRQSWFWAAIVGIVATCAVCYVYFSLPNDVHFGATVLTTSSVVREVAPRVLIFSVAYLLIVWAARNFGAARHNHTVNSHRAAALKSFDAFTAATEGDRELRLAILKQVTTAIFESQATAYLKEPASGNENLIQVFADAVTKKGTDA